MKRLFYIFPILLISISIFAQESELRIGEWKAMVPYNVGVSITQDSENVFIGSNIGLMILNKSNKSKTRLSRVDGLSDINIQHSIYDEQTENLVLIYESLIIDMIGPEGIRANLDLKNFNFTQGVKAVNAVSLDGAGGVLIAGNFGLTRFDIANEEFSFTARKLGINIYSACVFNDQIYIATNEGIFFSPGDNPNIDNVDTWTFLDNDELPAAYESYALNSHAGKLYLGINKAVYSYDEVTIEKVLEDDNFFPVYINSAYDKLLVAYGCVDQFCQAPLYLQTDTDDFRDIKLGSETCFGQNINAIADAAGNIWLSDNFRPLRYLEPDTDGNYSCKFIFSNDILDKGVFDLELNGEEIWIAPGGYGVNYDYLFNFSGLLGYVDGTWGQYFSNRYDNLDGLADISSVEVHPITNDIYFGSYLDGLVHFDRQADEMNIFNDANSSLGNIPGDPTRTRIADLGFDDDLNLWVSNYGANNPVSVLTAGGEWQNFLFPSKQLLSMTIDQNGYKWFVIGGSSNGVLVYDSGEDPLSTSDDRSWIINTNNSNLPTNSVNCISVDKDGDVWVGTQEGPVVFDCASNIFEESGCQGSLRIGETDNIGAYLLETENINCIGIDGANRKWFGTDNGIFVQSESGENQVLRLDIDNSPLFSNSIKLIKFDSLNGEAYIGTSEGILIIRGEAVDGGEFHSEVEVFPNPVRPDYDGPIAIRGVSENSRIKITTVDGKLVYETIALGGQAVWDGRDLKGRKPETGVYLIFVSSDENFDKPRTTTGKLLIVR
ncbi:MAG: two-component regulator propeller domain-containing protein [Saprospiraceae bacterium]|nr:two-component regulator propeller domain-containing protein [Saprospiraceae bacterium]